MRWELRLRAAERGVFKAVEMRRLLAQAGLPISAGKMSALWSATAAPVSVRLDDLEILCHVLRCDPGALLVPERPPDPLAGGWITVAGPPRTDTGEHAGCIEPVGEAGTGPGPRPVRSKLPPL
ncbi:helix-turn-helix domain-containing protein [Streptomyces sp. NPDC088847]|uniref:helix-turn-helix domain-containing protein n=1 Tax=Streptomyces sp. NPDC088847 TaxID=3365909 RepID=UPI00382FABFA